jgi:hypothetical protein
LFYSCFLPQNRPKPEKCGLTVHSISQGFLIFANIQVGGRGGSRDGEKATQQSKSHGKNAGVYSPMVGLVELSAFFTWTKKCSNLYVKL